MNILVFFGLAILIAVLLGFFYELGRSDQRVADVRRTAPDLRDLDWWQTSFAPRFVGHLPKVGTPLTDLRFALYIENREGIRKPYERPKEIQ